MADAQLSSIYSNLPSEFKKELLHFAEFLKQKSKTKKKLKERKFGGLKGMFVMSPYYIAPLERLKDYQPNEQTTDDLSPAPGGHESSADLALPEKK